MIARPEDTLADFTALWGGIFRWASGQNVENPSKLADVLTDKAREIVAATAEKPECPFADFAGIR